MAGHLIETDNNGPNSSIEISLTGIGSDQGTSRINEMLLGTGGGAGHHGLAGGHGNQHRWRRVIPGIRSRGVAARLGNQMAGHEQCSRPTEEIVVPAP